MTSKPGNGLPPPVRPLEWMTLVRDHPDRPPPDQCHVLDRLAQRLDWGEGRDRRQVPGHGFASVAQLVRDSGYGERTVKRATQWAREHGLLIRLTRGHRRGDGTATNSEWRLRRPSQQVSADGLSGSQQVSADGLRDAAQQVSADGLSGSQGVSRDASRGQSRRLKGSVERHYPRPDHPRPDHPSAHARAAADIIRAVYPDATDDEIEIIIAARIANGARSAEAVIAHEAREGRLWLPCDRDGPHGHSNACRDGDGPAACGMDRCVCRCHTEPKAARL
jgi:hypothetical protein